MIMGLSNPGFLKGIFKDSIREVLRYLKDHGRVARVINKVAILLMACRPQSRYL